MRRRAWLGVILAAAAGCGQEPKSEKVVPPAAISIGNDLRPHLGKTVVVRGLILALRQKGLPHLYEKAGDPETFLILAAADKDLEAFLMKRIEVTGKVVDVGTPLSKDGFPQQGYERGVLGVTVESIREVP